MTAPKREMLHDIEPNPHPARAWHAATPPVCPECGCDHSYPVWADRDALRSLYAERDRALARIERLTLYADELEGRIQDELTTFPVVTREAHIADARKQAGIIPGDLAAAPGGEGGQ